MGEMFCGGLFKIRFFCLQILTTFVFWLGSDFGALYTLGQVLEGIMIIDIIGFFIIMKRTLPYLEKSTLNLLIFPVPIRSYLPGVGKSTSRTVFNTVRGV